MNAEQLLEKFIVNHPDYWNFDNELKEVQKLKKACDNATLENSRHFSLTH